MNLKVSIITPMHNSEMFIEETISSVQNQEYKNWEMLIVDDCSSDKSIEIVEQIQSHDDRIKLFKNDVNLGAGLSRNIAIEKSSGDIIAFLDSDDIWFSNKLSLHLNYMNKKSSAFSHSSYGFIDENGKVIKSTYNVGNKSITYYDLLKKTDISCLTAMYDVRKVGKMYMPSLRVGQDYALWLDILKKGFKSDAFDVELAYYRQRNNSTTSNKFKLIKHHWYFLYHREKLSFFDSLYYTMNWAIRGFFKYYIK